METYSKTALPIYLRQEQFDALQALARERRVMMDELIREAVDALLESAAEDVPELLRERREELQTIAQLSVEPVDEIEFVQVRGDTTTTTRSKIA